MKNFSIDIHAHCSLKPYSNQYPNPPLSMWSAINNTCDGISGTVLGLFENSVKRGSQTAFEQAARGNVKILGISLFTYESGWTRKHFDKRKLLSCLTGISKTKLLHIFDDKIDIYDDITEEYKYIVRQAKTGFTVDGQQWSIKFLTKDILEKIANGTIDLDNQNIIYIFLNIEGIQSLGIRSIELDSENTDLPDFEKNKITKRINDIKNTWLSIPQYITFCHHFGNRLAGHARTIPPMLHFLGMNQERFMYKGITSNGFKVLFELLGDKQRRILIDIKHFSALARRDYYAWLKAKFPGEKIPILCSHTGFINKVNTLDILVQQTDDGNDLKDEYLLNWTINMCKEDLEEILASQGLIGVQIDLKRLIGKKYKKLIDDATDMERERLSCEIVWANIFTAVGNLNKKEAWDILCIGSDYDGIVSFLPQYETLAEYPKLKDKMGKVLTQMSFTHMNEILVNGNFLDNAEIERLMFGLTPAQIIEKIFSTNAINFWKKHFINQTLVLPDIQ